MINNRYLVEAGYYSLNHVGEELCGDRVEIVQPDEDTTIMVLSDGLGSGVKANILSTLTSKMLSTMVANNLSIKECVRAVARTLPICKERQVAYSTFTIIKVSGDMFVEIYNYDNPTPFLIHDGKAVDLDYSSSIIEGKTIYHAKYHASPYDTFFLMSDGVKYAGVGETLNFGWDLPQIKEYVTNIYSKLTSSKGLATELVTKCDALYNSRPGDDTTVGVVRIRERNQANLMFGPATNKDDDENMLSLFFSKGGTHIVSGGTTSNIVAKYLKKPLILDLDYVDKEIPPTAKIEGVDLVTEGIITLNKVLVYAEDYLKNNALYFTRQYNLDGASQIAMILLEEATDINFFVGCAVNPAHQGEDTHINIKIKMKIIDELAELLKKAGKNVKISYF